MGIGRLSCRRIDPAEMSVGAAIYDVDAAMRGVAEDEHQSAAHVELYHRIADRQPLQPRAGFGDDDRREAI